MHSRAYCKYVLSAVLGLDVLMNEISQYNSLILYCNQTGQLLIKTPFDNGLHRPLNENERICDTYRDA